MENNPNKQLIYTSLLMAFLAFATAGLFVLEARQEIPIFTFQFNNYAIISFTSLITMIVVLTLLVRNQRKSSENLWLILAVAFLTVYAIGELCQRLSVYPTSAVLWAQISGIGTYFAGACIFLFVLNYTRPSMRNAFLTVVIIVGAALFAFFDAASSVVYKLGPQATHLYPWGYNDDVGSGFIFHFMFIFGLYLTSIALMFSFRKRTPNKLLRTQSTIFLIGLSFPIVGGLIFDGLLPLFQINSYPPLALLFIAITGIFMAFGILKFHIFELSPAIVSQNILSTMNEAVIVTNVDLQIEFTNEEAVDLLGVAMNKMTKQPVTNFLNNDGVMHEAFRALLQSKGSSDILPPIEDIVIQRNGIAKSTRILTSPIVHGKQTEGYIFVISDITELKQAYSDLEEAKTGVEHTVEVRTRELRSAQKKLVEMDKLKTEFIMLTSHNLRTPLAIINGYTSALKAMSHDKAERHIIDNLDISSQRLGKLINNLLTISVIESKEEQLTRRPLKASELLWEVVNEADATANGNGNDDKFIRKIEVGNTQVIASPERLKAALGNILENAFKFTTQGEVNFNATVVGKKLVIETKDTGIGIKPDEIPKLFTKFHRGTDTLEFGYEGEGIGLYLTKLVIDEHEGTIKVESAEGKGTKVTITLPIAKVQKAVTKSE